MYPTDFEYHRPSSLAEAAKLLAGDPDARLLAGGHSLLPAMKLRLSVPTALVDLAAVPGLAGIAASGDELIIGALATHGEVAASTLVGKTCPLLAEAAEQIGDPAVRNRGTIGGSLAHADPGADYPTALLALDASVETGGGHSRRIALRDLYAGLLTTTLERAEIITAVRVPGYGGGTGGAYVKHRHPASNFAVVGVAALVTVAGGKCTQVRLAVGGVEVNPRRAGGAEQALTGRAPDADGIAAAAARIGEGVERPISDLYASGEFRLHLASVLAKRALALAVERAAG